MIYQNVLDKNMETKLVNVLPDMNRDPTLTRSAEERCAKCEHNEGNFVITLRTIFTDIKLWYMCDFFRSLILFAFLFSIIPFQLCTFKLIWMRKVKNCNWYMYVVSAALNGRSKNERFPSNIWRQIFILTMLYIKKYHKIEGHRMRMVAV